MKIQVNTEVTIGFVDTGTGVDISLHVAWTLEPWKIILLKST